MSNVGRMTMRILPSGVPGLDQVLGGGLPEYSFNLIAGGPGAGKTTLAQQILFANATAQQTAVYFTVLGEPPLKMLRYQQTYSFFDPAKVDGIIRYVNLSSVVLEGDLSKVLDSIVRVVEQTGPSLVVVDSFRTVVRAAIGAAAGELELQGFVQRLAMYLTSWQVTSFLVGEYGESEEGNNPVFTVADGILWLRQSAERNSIVRKLQIVKMRGRAPLPGLHTFRITDAGIQVFPRIGRRLEVRARVFPQHRLSTGVHGLDDMLGGGIPAGDAVLVAGPSGSGKTVFATQFIAEGVRQGEPGVLAVFEEHPEDYLSRAKALGFDLAEMVERNQLKIMYLRPLDLSVDEALSEIQDSVSQVGAKRVVIDSLSGFELALAPTFREDFRESLYRLVGALTGSGVTVVMTVEVIEAYTDLRFSPHEVSFLADDIILQRYIELEGQLRKMITVVKMRSSSHSTDLREYEVTPHGLEIRQSLAEYRGLITGVPERRQPIAEVYPGLNDPEVVVLRALIAAQESTAEALALATGLRRQALTAALERLVALNYAIKVDEHGQTLYRPVARTLGAT
ncbi:MAG TPA: ATPase domain-containing protein [Chloroflexota bacterium]|nr:ATPase domain-containing protein [Chloroflexota bacterium]